MEVIVPDEFLSVAIGKRGQNVRLASKLTGWHLDVNSESSYSEAMRSGYDSLVELPGVGISMADALYEKGFFSAEELSKASIEDLIQIRGIGEEKAMQLVEKAKQYVTQLQQAPVAEEAVENDEALMDAESDIDETTETADNPDESLMAEDTDAKDN
jgi:N utilization substance protein A